MKASIGLGVAEGGVRNFGGWNAQKSSRSGQGAPDSAQRLRMAHSSVVSRGPLGGICSSVSREWTRRTSSAGPAVPESPPLRARSRTSRRRPPFCTSGPWQFGQWMARHGWSWPEKSTAGESSCAPDGAAPASSSDRRTNDLINSGPHNGYAPGKAGIVPFVRSLVRRSRFSLLDFMKTLPLLFAALLLSGDQDTDTL